MKFKLRAVSYADKCRYFTRLPNGRYGYCTLDFGDIKSAHVYQETSEYQTINGKKEEISQWYVDIDTIEDLVALEIETNNSLIVNDGEIVIYDGCMA